MEDNKYKVYKSENIKKGIISVNFLNPSTGKKTTKSLGKGIGIDNEKAQPIIDQLTKLINCEEYFLDFEGYLKAKEDFSEYENVINMVFANADLIKKNNEASRDQMINNIIPIKDGMNFKTNSIQLIGSPGSGKTKTIQQLLGSIKYNTPASTTSNTTIGDFEAYCNQDSKSLDFVVGILGKEELSDYLRENFIKTMVLSLLLKGVNESLEEDMSISEEAYNELYTEMVFSSDMKFRLGILLGRGVKEEYKEVINQLVFTAKDMWKVYSIKNEIAYNYFEASEVIKRDFYLYLDEEFEESSELDLEIQRILGFIQKEIENIIFKVIRHLIHIKNNRTIDENIFLSNPISFELKIITTKKSMVYSSEEIEQLEFKLDKKEWVRGLTFTISYAQLKEKPNKELREAFFSVFKYISCANEEDGNNLFPVVAAGRIHGNFRPIWKGDNDVPNYILIDSEGFGHDVDCIGFSRKITSNMQLVDKILWVANSTQAMSIQDKAILEELSRNGCLQKATLCFNRTELIDNQSEYTIESKRERVKKLIDNLFKSFEKDPSDTGVDFTVFRETVKERILMFQYLDKVIDDVNGVLPEEIQRLINDEKDDAMREYLLRKATKKDVSLTIESINNILTFVRKVNDRVFDLPYPNYYLIKLSRQCDKDILDFKNSFITEIRDAHWNTVRAFTCRMYYNSSSNRGWGGFFPEQSLKKIAKNITLKYLQNPQNYSQYEKARLSPWVLDIQSELAKSIDQFIEQIIYADNKEKWKELYFLSGPGSGNRRKYEVKKMIDNMFDFDKDSENENIIFNELKTLITDNCELKEMRANIYT